MIKIPALVLLSVSVLFVASAQAETSSQDAIAVPELHANAKSVEKPSHHERVFGVGLGAGYENETGNAQAIYGVVRSPALDLRASYWFDPRLAIQLSAQNSRHGYNIPPDGNTDVNLFRVLLQAKYSIAEESNPHLIAGIGNYWRTDTIGSDLGQNASQTQSALGFNFGAGFEFPLVADRAFLQLEAVVHDVSFSDDSDPRFVTSGINDRTGLWIVAEAALVFTW